MAKTVFKITGIKKGYFLSLLENNQTETQMSLLTQKERVKALARLLGGEKITEAVLANAQEMLDLAEKS